MEEVGGLFQQGLEDLWQDCLDDDPWPLSQPLPLSTVLLPAANFPKECQNKSFEVHYQFSILCVKTGLKSAKPELMSWFYCQLFLSSGAKHFIILLSIALLHLKC